MASLRSNLLLRELCHVSPFLSPSRTIPAIPIRVHVGIGGVRCAAAQSGDGGKKVSARLSMMQQILQDAEERALSAGSESTPKITLGKLFIYFIPRKLYFSLSFPFFFLKPFSDYKFLSCGLILWHESCCSFLFFFFFEVLLGFGDSVYSLGKF